MLAVLLHRRGSQRMQCLKKFPPGFHFVQEFFVMPTAQSCLPRSLGLNLKESMSCAVQASRIRLTLLCARTARSELDRLSRHLAGNIRGDGKQAGKNLFRFIPVQKNIVFLAIIRKKIGN